MAAGVHYGIAERIKIAPNIFSARRIRGLPAIVERPSFGGVIVRLATGETNLEQTDCKSIVIVRRQICISNRRPSETHAPPNKSAMNTTPAIAGKRQLFRAEYLGSKRSAPPSS